MCLRIPNLLLVAMLSLTSTLPSAWGLTLTTVDQENKLGEDAYKEILEKEKVCTDKELNAFVRQVADRITAVAPDMGFKYEVVVLESDKVNAFCLPGGKIAVYTGILPYCQNEAGLATVMGHEVAHAILRHGGQRMTQQMMVGGGGFLFGKILEYKGVGATAGKVAMGAYGYGTQLGILLPYSRSHETDADDAGLEYLAKAGYDPREAPRFWERFSVMKSDIPTFLSTHPGSEDRSQRLAERQAQALKWYEKSARHGLGQAVPPRYQKEILGVAPTAPNAPGAKLPAASQAKVPPVQVPAARPQPHLPQDEAVDGIREALLQSAGRATTVLRKDGGFGKNKDVMLRMPAMLKDIAAAVRESDKEERIEDFIEGMNKAAERGVKEHGDLLIEAIRALRIDQPNAILGGAPDAATSYLKTHAGEGLKQKFSEVMKEEVVKAGARKALIKMVLRAGPDTKGMLEKFDLDAYVVDRAIAGLFLKMAEEEKNIRANPNIQANAKIKKVFGALKP